jgi:hypothetical protein
MKSVFNEQMAMIFCTVMSFFVLMFIDLTFCEEREKPKWVLIAPKLSDFGMSDR